MLIIMSAKIKLLKNVKLFTHLKDLELEEIAQYSEYLDYKEGQKIFIEGSFVDELYIVEKGKVLIIPIRGMILDIPRKRFLHSRPSMVQEIVSQLKLAEKDKEVRAVLFKIHSRGGSATASDVIYHEIVAFKKRTGAKVVVAMMDVAASGGYYVSLPADFILAHPTTLTGSIGVIFMRPTVTGLMAKIGLDIQVDKSGKNKDMGSPFRQSTEEEQRILQGLTDELGERFVSLVAKHRKIDQEALANISTARVYLGKQALQLGLVDKIGYITTM